MAMAGATMAFIAKWTGRKQAPQEPIRMLTQDGRLVEVPRNKIPSTRAKATTSEVASWIWKNQKK